MDIVALIGLASSIVDAITKAAPVIIQDVKAAEPFVQAIVTLARAGGEPSAEDFAEAKRLLDVNSAILAKRAAAAQALIDSGQG